MSNKRIDIIRQNKAFLWIALATGLILLLPLIASRFTNEVDWAPSDFIIIGALLFGVGSLFILIARRVEKKYRLIVGVLLAIALLWIWAELAVGVFTPWGS